MTQKFIKLTSNVDVYRIIIAECAFVVANEIKENSISLVDSVTVIATITKILGENLKSFLQED